MAGDDGLRVIDVDDPALRPVVVDLTDVRQVACARDSGDLAVIARAPGDARPRAFLVTSAGARRPVEPPWHGLEPVSIAVTADGALVVLGLRDPNIRVEPGTPSWQLPPEGPLCRFEVTKEAVTYRDHILLPGVTQCLAFSTAGDLMLAGSTSGQIGLVPRVLEQMEDHLRPPGAEGHAHEGPVRAVALTADGARVVSVGDRAVGHEVKVWDLERRAVLSTTTAPGRALGVEVSPDGGAVVVWTTNGGVHLRRLER
ncbi:MAG: hypothetical protein M9894_09210 [Planctomycetes bacterium]|nr:hypothetical protein [Planctomycetota bacterium]